MRERMIFALVLASLPGIAAAQGAAPEAPPYCSELQRIATLAATKERFASIAGKPREGNFLDTSLTLTGWSNCALYGSATYTCDSRELNSAQHAEQAQSDVLQEIKSCLGEGWVIAPERASPSYVVLHDVMRPISITLSTDETADRKHVVHLIMFVRKN
jgi:hypothetical protein